MAIGFIKYLKSVIDDIIALLGSSATAGPYTYTDAGGEQKIYEDTSTKRRKIWLDASNRYMTQTGTFRIYRKVDGSNYDLWIKQAVTVGATDERAWDSEFTINKPWKITYEEDADEGIDRAIPYNVITQNLE